MFCRKCGKQIPDDSAFCYKCGVRVILNVSKSASDKPITLEKPEQKASGSLEDSFTPNVKEEVICPECGRKIPSLPCLYCIEENINILRNKGKMSMPNIASDVGTNTIEQLNDNSITLEKSPIPKTETYVSSEKLPENNEESQHRYKRALAALECSNDIDSLRRASDEFFALGAYLDSRKKSQDCKDKIYKIQNNVSTAIPRYDEQKAVKSSTSSASSTILENASLPNNNGNNDDPNTSKSEAETAVNKAIQNAILQVQEENRIKDSNTPVVLVNVNIVTKIISYVSLGLGLLFEFVIAKNIDVSTYNGVMNHNAIVVFSYVFFGIFLCCLFVRIICALIIAGKRGELKGTVTFVVVGVIITIILSAILKSWWQGFILFGIIAMSYIGHKIRDWM